MGDWRSGSAVALQANGHRFKSCISHHQLHATRLRGIFFSRAFSSAGEHFLHTEGVIGSIPVTPTTLSRSAYGRPFFLCSKKRQSLFCYSVAAFRRIERASRGVMTLRKALTVRRLPRFASTKGTVPFVVFCYEPDCEMTL